MKTLCISFSKGGRQVKINQKGIDLIRHFEGLYLESYKCPAGVWTIGYGHTGGVSAGEKISEEKAEDLLREDLGRFEKGMEELVKVKLNEDQFSALVSFSFNLGLGNLSKSTLLKKLNTGDYAGAADEFPKWRKAAGKVLQGLVKRRAAERELFLSL